MDFGPIVNPVEIKKGAFGGTYFRKIYSGVNDKFYKNSLKNWKTLTKNIMPLIFLMSVSINMVLNVEHH